MKQEKKSIFIGILTSTVIGLTIVPGILGGFMYTFFPRKTLDSAMVDFCKEWGGEFMPMKVGGNTGCSMSGDVKECLIWSCIKEDTLIIKNTGSDTVFVDFGKPNEVRGQFIQQANEKAHKKCDETAKTYFKTTDRIYSTTVISKSGNYEIFDCYVKKEQQSGNIRILSDYTI